MDERQLHSCGSPNEPVLKVCVDLVHVLEQRPTAVADIGGFQRFPLKPPATV